MYQWAKDAIDRKLKDIQWILEHLEPPQQADAHVEAYKNNQWWERNRWMIA